MFHEKSARRYTMRRNRRRHARQLAESFEPRLLMDGDNPLFLMTPIADGSVAAPTAFSVAFAQSPPKEEPPNAIPYPPPHNFKLGKCFLAFR